MDSVLERLKRTVSASLGSAIEHQMLSKVLRDHSIVLPPAHEKLLSLANGLTVYFGYFRVFGVGCSDGIDLLKWNDVDIWKFAWNLDLSGFLCFGETAWGDQYAYAVNELKPGGTPKVHYLDSLTMESEIVSESFEEFMDNEFLRCSENPYDSMIPSAYKKLGLLDWNSHIIYMPSLLLSGQDSVENIIKTNALASMIINGDIATQCSDETCHRQVKALENYVDCMGRTRIKVVWT